MPPKPTPTFTVAGAVWDEQVTDLMWIVIVSTEEIPGDYAVRIWWNYDGQGYPADENNECRKLCEFDPAQLVAVPDAADATTVLKGLRANRCQFGCPWLAGTQGVERPQPGEEEPKLLFWLQVVPEGELV